MLSKIIAATPVWVWPLLLALGFSQTRPRNVSLARILILPMVMTVLSLAGPMTSFGISLAVLLAWCVSAGLAACLVIRRHLPALTRHESATGRF